ncbi:MAG: hypothetical protein KatS3mg070_2957 [Meiothermus sp.]|uniref:transposase n=1 Tax=Meiothermus sp. TaxID=1955249 RepID=UPI0021DCF538|nr:transposase [Meiothermus sp.]GIW29594.1 MAG: hypothetical protein KatS3mg070_2957 [Meiothermus sp.]
MELRQSRYPSDLTDQEWAILAPLMPQPSAAPHRPRRIPGGNPERHLLHHPRRLRWRMMPYDLPTETVYHYFRLWRKSGF